MLFQTKIKKVVEDVTRRFKEWDFRAERFTEYEPMPKNPLIASSVELRFNGPTLTRSDDPRLRFHLAVICSTLFDGKYPLLHSEVMAQALDFLNSSLVTSAGCLQIDSDISTVNLGRTDKTIHLFQGSVSAKYFMSGKDS